MTRRRRHRGVVAEGQGDVVGARLPELAEPIAGCGGVGVVTEDGADTAVGSHGRVGRFVGADGKSFFGESMADDRLDGGAGRPVMQIGPECLGERPGDGLARFEKPGSIQQLPVYECSPSHVVTPHRGCCPSEGDCGVRTVTERSSGDDSRVTRVVRSGFHSRNESVVAVATGRDYRVRMQVAVLGPAAAVS